MAEAKLDYKKAYPDLYLPKTKPSVIDVPAMGFIMVAGKGDPNEENGEYQRAVGILYGLAFTIKMSKLSSSQPDGYFDYVVPPLEGLWWNEGEPFNGITVNDKSAFSWISMIRQPEFVTPEVFAWAADEASRKKPELDMSLARFETWHEGLCAQVMHKGPYDDEPATIIALDRFIEEQGYASDFSDDQEAFPIARRHHEIYLGDPRRSKPENMKTVIRHPIRTA